MNGADWASWQPSPGETIHLRQGNPWHLPAGRYTLRLVDGRAFELVDRRGALAVYGPDLASACTAGILTPIPADDAERERVRVQLRTAAPLRSPRRQHDASALALFSHASEGLLL